MTSLFIKRKPIIVVDSIMGSGKTSWAIQYIKKHKKRKKFLFVTPFLSEIQRVVNATDGEFVAPVKEDGVKMPQLKEMLRKNRHIACTHQLFKNADRELLNLFEDLNYTLIIDEAMEVISEIKMKSADVEFLFNTNLEDGKQVATYDSMGFVTWLDDSYDGDIYKVVKNAAKTGNLCLFKEKATSEKGDKRLEHKLYWIFPKDVFKAFNEIFILTYMFKGQLQANYFEMFNLESEFKSISKVNGNYELVDYVDRTNEDRRHLKELINIYYKSRTDRNDLNEIGKKRSTFSKNSLGKLVKDKVKKKVIKNNITTYYRRKVEEHYSKVIWTTLKDFDKDLLVKGLKTRFVPVNARATNDYADATTCIYIANRFLRPFTRNFFNDKGIKLNEDLFALSELLQWLFRSAIRNGEPINVYIPSERMRTLLERYLNNEI